MIRHILTAFAAVLAAATLAAQQPVDFKVGTWNLEFLGADGNFRNNLPNRDDADYAALGKKVRELGVAVLAVQEINDEASLRKVAAGAGASWDCLLGTSGEWDDKKTAQRVGFLWDKAAVQLLHCEELLQLPREFEGKSIFHRVPVTAAFRHVATGADFRLVTVHLKAGRKPDDEHKRRGESTLLAKWLDELQAKAGEDQDVILLGDFNCTYGTQPEQAFEASGKRRWLEHMVPTPTIMHFPEPIDQVVVAENCVEVVRASLFVDGDFDGMDKEAWRKIHSDHFPVTVTLRALGDDDEATFAVGPVGQTLPTSRRGAVAAKPADWPYVAGVRVLVQVSTDRTYEGKLTHDVPADGQGWIRMLLDGEAQPRLVHCATVMSLRLP